MFRIFLFWLARVKRTSAQLSGKRPTSNDAPPPDNSIIFRGAWDASMSLRTQHAFEFIFRRSTATKGTLHTYSTHKRRGHPSICHTDFCPTAATMSNVEPQTNTLSHPTRSTLAFHCRFYHVTHASRLAAHLNINLQLLASPHHHFNHATSDWAIPRQEREDGWPYPPIRNLPCQRRRV